MPTRNLIPALRKISWDTGEMCEFASCLVSALQHLGRPLSYPAVMGACGAAFRFTLNPGAWDFGNYSIRNFGPDPHEPIRRAFAAAGYECLILPPAGPAQDAARILASIDRGLPVLAFGVVGPSDCVLIAGYDEGGEVILGWSTFQDIPADHNIPHDLSGYFRKPAWHAGLGGTVLIGSPLPARPARELALDALRWAVTLARQPAWGQKLSGLAALRAFAAEMTDEQYFPADNPDLLGWRYVSVTINFTMLRDHTAAPAYLRQVARAVPAFQPELEQAAAGYQQVATLVSQMDAILSDNFAAWAMQAIADPAVRRAYAEKILAIADVEEQAIRHIEALLARCA